MNDMNAFDRPNRLDQIIGLLKAGLTQSEVAETLGISNKTVNGYLKRGVLDRGVRTAFQLAYLLGRESVQQHARVPDDLPVSKMPSNVGASTE